MRGVGVLLTRVFIYVYLAFILLMAGFGWMVYRLAGETVTEQMAHKCAGIAIAAATMLEQDAAGYKAFAESLDTSTAYYRHAKAGMEKIRRGNENNIIFIYTEKRISDTEMCFVLDGEPESSAGFSPPGSTDLLTDTRIEGYETHTLVTGDFVTTSYGTLLSAYAPITDQDTGEFLGLVGVDVSIDQYNELMGFSSTLIIASIGGMLFMVALLLLFSSTRIAKFVAIDSLTNAYNKSFFLRSLKARAKQSRKTDEPLLVIMADLDHFKHVNDTYGHIFGDKVLAEVSKAIKSALRESDCLARYGGEEFSAYFPELKRKSAAAVLERIRRTVEETEIENTERNIVVNVTISIGATYLSPDHSPPEVLAEADKALYEAKKTRNAVVFHHDMAKSA